MAWGNDRESVADAKICARGVPTATTVVARYNATCPEVAVSLLEAAVVDLVTVAVIRFVSKEFAALVE